MIVENFKVHFESCLFYMWTFDEIFIANFLSERGYAYKESREFQVKNDSFEKKYNVMYS